MPIFDLRLWGLLLAFILVLIVAAVAYRAITGINPEPPDDG